MGFARFGGEIQDKASTLKGGEKGAYRHNLLSIVQNDFATLFRGDVTGSIVVSPRESLCSWKLYSYIVPS